MSYSDKRRIKIDYRRRTKIKTEDRQLPLIDMNKRVIHFGDDLELFKIVSELIMKRVDLDRVDLDDDHPADPGYRGAIDLDAITGVDPAAPDGEATGGAGAPRRRLSDRFGLYRHPDRYGAANAPVDDA